MKKALVLMVLMASSAVWAGSNPILGGYTPTNLTVSSNAVDYIFDWADATEVSVQKWSVDVCMTVTVSYVYLTVPGEVTGRVCVSFGTSDRTDGDPMSQSDLTVAKEDLLDAAAEAAMAKGLVPAGATIEDVVIDWGEARVKALGFKKGSGKTSQNNNFSEPASLPLD
jgi:hypothetical protein